MRNGIESLGRIRLQGIALLVIALGVGVLSGMALERVRATRMARYEPPPFGPLEEGLPPGLARLDLTTEQEGRIRAIFEAARPAMDSILRAMLPRLRGARDSVSAEIRALLTPAQRERFDEFEGLEPRRGPRGMGPGDPGGSGPGPWPRPPAGGPPVPPGF